MRRRRLVWHLAPTYILLAIAALVFSAWYATRVVRAFYTDQTRDALAIRAELIKLTLRPYMRAGNPSAVDSICKEYGSATGTRVTVIAFSGRVFGESAILERHPDNHADRPEIIAAFAGRPGSSVRYSHTTLRNMMYTAVPVDEGGKVVAVVRTAAATDEVDEFIADIRSRLFLVALIVALFAVAAGMFDMRRATARLGNMSRIAHAYAAGDFRERLPASRIEEINELAESLNSMATQLDERIRELLQQHDEQDAVLSSMIEGVIAVDAEERVINTNAAAARLLGTDLAKGHGRMIQEAVRNTDLQRFVGRTLSSREPLEGEIVLQADKPRFLHAHGTILRDATGQSTGALIVLHDITRLRSLEDVRREFVANVSHELKTPLTSIKVSVETLLDGAMNNSEDARRFLDIILRHADRLQAIVEDLLSLSRLEQEVERGEIVAKLVPVKPVLDAAVLYCGVAAKERGIQMSVSCPDDLCARMDPPLVEQAVVNLVDNAVKYSDANGAVGVVATRQGDEVRIDVRDSGCGIDSEHLPRIFERFYRVDKARSRKVGGTGLGLSIVKHIIQAHGGRVSVESVPRQGSVFSVFLPGV
jgi:two-component system phosphate regulon sensor histidine kinase PhoR